VLHDGSEARIIQSEQMSIAIGRDFVLSFEESEPTAFDTVRARLRDNRADIRAQGADFLAYSLLDAVVDSYFLVLEQFGGRIERLQEELLGRSTRRTETSLQHLRREMVLLRKSVWPLREVIGSLERGGSALFRRETWVYLRDVYDHVIHMIDTLESYHEMLTYMLDLHLLSATNRLNEVIKVITVIATIFSPPMLIASIYGMNFKHMPELTWPWGYAFAGGLMIATAGAMYWFFRHKRWI
jgi:magnesium transporter